MLFRAADRAQSIQVGAVLLLGALVLSFSLYQAVVVPDQNREVEFKHNQEVQGELQDLRNAIVSMAGGGDSRSVSVTLGTQYPSRIVALNPGSPSGSLRTRWTTNLTQNATVQNAEAVGEVGDFWNGSARVYNTGGLVYRPGYNEYTQAPATVYENSILYNRFSDSTLTLTGQQLIDGNSVSLVTLNGSYGTSRTGSVSLDVRPVSASSNTVTVTNATSTSNVTIELASALSAQQWRESLSGEFVGEGGNVVRVESTAVSGAEYQIISVVLQRSVDYDLRIARAGIGSGVTRPEDAYLTGTSGAGSTVPEGGTTQVTVEVRDALNNPVGQRFVYAGTRRGGSSVSPSQSRSNSDGTVTVTYEAPADISGTSQSNDTVNASLVVPASATDDTTFDPSTAQNVSIPVTVTNSDGSGLGGSGGGGGPYDLNWQDPTQTGVTCAPANDPNGVCTVDAGKTLKAVLPVGTDPTVDGANVDFSINDSSIGTVSPSTNRTNNLGETTTTLTPKAEGGLTVFAASASSGDRLTVDVVNATTIESVGEVQTVSLDQPSPGDWQTITYAGTYADPVVVARPLSFNDSDPAYARVRNVGGGSFELRIDEFENQDGVHGVENVTYVAFEKGTHTLANGSQVVAGETTISGGSFQSVTYETGFGSTPVVFSKPQTVNDDTPVVTRQRNVGAASYDVELEESEAGGQGGHGSETVGYIAIEQNTSTNQGSLWETDTTGDRVEGVDNYPSPQFEQESFDNSYSSPPALIAQAQTAAGPNTAWERLGTRNATDFRVAIDEETAGDGERSHTTENVGYFAFERQGGIFTADDNPPSITGFSATNPSGQDIRVSFNSTEQLNGIAVDVTGPDPVSLDETDFTETANGDGTFEYVGTYAANSDGDYTTTLNSATDSAGNDGASGESDTASIDTTPPTVTSASISNAPIDDSDAGTSQTVTVEFSESMDTSVAPTVEITGLSGSGSPYTVSQSSYSGSTFTGSVTIPDDDEEATATISVGGAEDAAGNVQSPDPDTSNTFEVDTVAPQDPSSTTIRPSQITSSDENNVEVDVTFGSTPESGTVFVRLTDGSTTITASTSANTGGQTTTVSGIDVSSLDDGAITSEARIVDDAGNENPAGFTASDTAQKDSDPPTISDYRVTNPSGRDVDVTFNSTEQLSNIEVDITGIESATLTDPDFTETANGDGTYEYVATYGGSTDGDYTATLNVAEDSSGNNGASGQSDTVTVDTSPPGVVDATVTNTPINESDTASPDETLTVTFNQTMNQSVDPTVEITGLSASYVVSGTWLDSTTWSGPVDFRDDDEEVTATIDISGAEDTAGTVMSPDTSNTFEVDTDAPQNATETRIRPDPIGSSTQTGVDVDVNFSSAPESGTVFVELSDGNGNTVTGSATTAGTTTTVTGIDVSGLNDGTITTVARIEDDVGNENPAGFTAASTATKDTNAPTITTSAFDDSDDVITESEASNGARRTVSVTFNESMDTSSFPTVAYENITAGSEYTVVDQTWVDSTTYDETVEFADTSTETPVTVQVSGATDVVGNQMSLEEPEAFSYGGIGYNDDAAAYENATRSDSPDANEGLFLSITNGYSTATSITSVTIDPRNGAIDELDDVAQAGKQGNESELFVDTSTNGYNDLSGGEPIVDSGGLTIDLTQSSSDIQQPRIASTDTARLYFYRFLDSSDTEIDVSCEAFDVTVTFNNKSTAAFTATASPPTGDCTTPPSTLTLDSPSSQQTRQSDGTLDVTYSYTEDNPDRTTVSFDDGNGNVANYSIDDSDYAGDDSAKTVTLGLSSPDATTGNGFVGGNTYDITVETTDVGGQSSSVTETGRLKISDSVSSASVASLVPNANGQRQRITVTVGVDLPSSESIEIDLSDAQAPDKVDYQGSGATVQKGPAASTLAFGPQNTDDAVLTYSPSSDISAGTSIELRINSILVDSRSTQSNPYTVSITRSDSGSATAQFRVDRNTGTSELRNLGVTSLTSNRNGQSQRIVFEPTTKVPEGDIISIDLSDAQNTGTDVNYDSAKFNINVSTQNKKVSTPTSDTAFVRYTAPSGGFAANTPIKINVTGVNTDGMDNAPYEIGFSRSDADTASTTFDARQPGAGVAFVDSSSSTLSSYHADGYVVDYGVGVSALGPKTHDFDGNGETDIPYIRNGNLYLNDSKRGERTVSTDNFGGAVAVGAFDGDSATGTYIYASDSNNGKLERVTAGGTVTELTGGNVDSVAVAGVADIDGDTFTELVYLGSGEVKYLDDDGSVKSTGYGQVGTSSGAGIGTPADFDGDGTARTPVVDGSNNIALIADDGTKTTVRTANAAKSGIATFDADADGEQEIIYIDANNNKALTMVDTDGNANDGVKTALRDVIGEVVRAIKGPGAG